MMTWLAIVDCDWLACWLACRRVGKWRSDSDKVAAVVGVAYICSRALGRCSAGRKSLIDLDDHNLAQGLGTWRERWPTRHLIALYTCRVALSRTRARAMIAEPGNLWPIEIVRRALAARQSGVWWYCQRPGRPGPGSADVEPTENQRRKVLLAPNGVSTEAARGRGSPIDSLNPKCPIRLWTSF